MQSSFSPTQIFEEGTTEEKGENARLTAFVGAIAVGDLVKSTLGPKGMDKILQSACVYPPSAIAASPITLPSLSLHVPIAILILRPADLACGPCDTALQARSWSPTTERPF